jgi:hypothetical protein
VELETQLATEAKKRMALGGKAKGKARLPYLQKGQARDKAAPLVHAGHSYRSAFLSYGRVPNTSARRPTTSSADVKNVSGTRTACAHDSFVTTSTEDLSLCGPPSFANALRPQSQNTTAPMHVASVSGRGSLSGPRSLTHGAGPGASSWESRAGREAEWGEEGVGI